jgi:hypothetical protein
MKAVDMDTNDRDEVYGGDATGNIARGIEAETSKRRCSGEDSLNVGVCDL